MIRTIIAVAALWLGFCDAALAQSCTSYTALTNGTPANATTVMANFNCAALTGAAVFTGNAVFDADVAIGNSSPTDALDVSAPVVFGGLTERMSLNSGSLGFNRKVATGLIYNSSAYAYQFQHSQSTIAASDNLAIQIYAPSGSTVTGTAWTVNGAGQVTVGGGSSSLLFYVNGTAGGTAGWTTVSDGRLKTNVGDLGEGIDTVMRLHPVRFEWRPREDRTVGADLILASAHPQVGFIAQEVAPIVPEAVVEPTPENGGLYGLKMETLVPVLVAAVKEQQAEIQALRAEMAALKGHP